MRKAGSYLAESLQNRIRQFFLSNHEEELSYRDMALKFDCTEMAARNVIRELGRGAKPCQFESMRVVRLKRAEATA